MIEQAFAKFGKNSFQNAIFYSNKECLRFELSEGDSYINLFTSSLQKSSEIIDTLFENSEDVSVCLTFSGDSYVSHLSVFRELKYLQLEIPKSNYQLREWVEEDEWHKNYLFFTIKKSEIHKLLFGKLGNELGIKPSFWFDLYMFDIELGILVHPYDDRGMDVVGPNKFMLQRLYKKYHHMLLEYDIKTMEQWFGAL